MESRHPSTENGIENPSASSSSGSADKVRVWRFGGFELDEQERRLTAHGERVAISPRAFELLVALVGNGGRLLRRDELLDRVWPDTFVEDATLGRHISDVRRALGTESQILETVPKSGYRLNVEATLLPRRERRGPSTSAASEEQSAAASPLPGLESSNPTARPRAAARILLTVSLVLIALVLWRLIFPPARTRPEPSIRAIAVLPFTPIGGARESHLEIGLADELIRHLSSIPDLEVRSLAAVLPFSGEHFDPLMAARSLAVDAILEGSLRRSDGRLRVGARLLSVSDGRSLWAGSFDHADADLQAIESAIARETTLAIGATLRPRPGPGALPIDPEAHDLYLRGRYFWSKRSSDAHRRAIVFFERALEVAPDYAEAEAGLAAAYALLAGLVDPPETYETARRHALRALSLDPESADAQSVLGLVAMNYDADWRGAEAAFERALAMQPNHPTTHHWLGELLALSGRSQEGQAILERAQRLDPLSLAIATDLAKAHYFAGHWDEAVRRSELVLEMDPLYTWAWAWLGVAELERGHTDRALASLRRFAELEASPFARALSIWGLEGAGLSAEASAELDRLESEAQEGYVMPVALVMARLGHGQTEGALDALEMLVAGRHNRLGVATSPLFASLGEHPRFVAIMDTAAAGDRKEGARW